MKEALGFRRNWLITAFLACWAILIGASVAQDTLLIFDVIGDKNWMLDLDVERSIYTWYSTILLFIAGLVLGLQAWQSFAIREFNRWYWLMLSAVFLLLSLDEAISIHEKLSSLVPENLSGGIYFRWVVPAAVLCGLGLLASIPFLRSLPRSTWIGMIVSAVVFLSGAIGMELVGGAVIDQGHGLESGYYRAEVNIEEALEGLGVILFISVLLSYQANSRPALSIRFG